MKHLLKTATILMGASALAVSAFAMDAQAQSRAVNLILSPTDADGLITLGELFEGAGAASGVVVGRRAGPSAVLDAAQVQVAARRAGLDWANTAGIRRIIVREGGGAPIAVQSAMASAPARAGAMVEALTFTRSLSAGEVIQPEDVMWTQVQAHLAPAAGPQDAAEIIGLSARRPLRAGQPVNIRDLAAPQVIARNDMVEVLYQDNGIELTITGRAQRNAMQGDTVSILNLQSNRTIEAVALAPGRAIAGPAAQMMRSASTRSNPYAAR
ncbi:flagellar basal body P-ring formation chaperone FlgA [Brevundimonas sp.]|uniref:flagellar basal body P-ring formation chaperone FlgA n=1 Tax=Brevundimonas sp. TaxID=1871086 RepID=UPI002898D91F|nr:flagellar basal body P-ring formation chaperone FlgA [Brevundimonas sp.]